MNGIGHETQSAHFPSVDAATFQATRRYFALWLVAIFYSSTALAGPNVCTSDQARRAEAVSDAATSWKQLHRQFRKFAICDDGAVAEGFSESNTLLLADHWGTIQQLEPMIASDPAFRTFIVRHVDATVPAERLRRIARNADKQCPGTLKDFCQEIQAAAEK
ncbi:hypothetical protein [Burkholderia sp. BCC0419]|uniref:hypothetical protein n=1 Tax=Burkholderia sp. BCC0419 TaxID=486878 RepID=UPI00158E4385|nr:hypothetical protein [Burkholderia sp. BCC0419]